MSEKYPFLPHRKQGVLGIETTRWKADGVERAVVVTAERHHVTVFVHRDDGTWAWFEREHRGLDRAPTSPSGTVDLRWSGQIGVASDEKTLAVCYKRRLPSGSTGLWLDRLRFDPANGGVLEPLSSDPVRVPFGEFGFQNTGFWIRAFYRANRLSLVTQAMGDKPLLVLLSAEGSELAEIDDDPDRWRSVELDGGGFDLDAIEDGERLEIVHRRSPGHVTVPRKAMPSPDGAILVDDPTWNLPPLANMLAPLVRVVADLPTQSVVSVDATLPPLEHPQILRGGEDFLVVGDRPRIGFLTTNAPEGETPILRVWFPQGEKRVVRWMVDHWRAGRLYDLEPERVPRPLSVLRGAQQLLGRNDDTFEIATLMPQHSVALLADQSEEKRDTIVLAHEHRRTGTLAASTFHLSAGPGADELSVQDAGMAVLDIGRERLGEPVVGIPNRAENAQFEPLSDVGPHDHGEGFRIEGPRGYVNTMGGLAAAPLVRGAELYAYVDFGDAGLRVFHESEVVPPPPMVERFSKTLPPDAVVGPGGEQSVWVELDAPLLRFARVPTYRAPYAEFLRGFQDGETGELSWLAGGLLLPLGALRLLNDFMTPPSLHGSQHPAMDVMPLAAMLAGAWDIETEGPPLAAEAAVLRVADALAVESFLSATSGEAETESADDDAFVVRLVQTPTAVFPGTSVQLDADSGGSGVQFTFIVQTEQVEEGEEAPTEELTGPSQTLTFPTPGNYAVELVATDDTGDTVTVRRTVTVGETLWNTLWAPFDAVSGSDGFTLGAFDLELLQYRFEFRLTGNGVRDTVTIRWLPQFQSQLQFLDGGIQQGRVRYRIDLGFDTRAVQLANPLGLAVNVEAVNGRYAYGRPFTPSVLTTDRRSEDPLRGRRFPRAVETAQRGEADGFAREWRNVPAALAMKPVDVTELELTALTVETSPTALAQNVTWLVGTLVTLGLAGLAAVLVFSLAIGAAASVTVVALLIAALAGGLAALAVVLVGLGLVWLLVNVVAPPLLQAAAQAVVRTQMEEGLGDLRSNLDGQGLLDYAGEGLAEGIAVETTEKLQQMGHAVADPERRGRDRFVHARYETVFVSAGRCKIRVRLEALGGTGTV